jgi:hypothetical protein
VVSNPKWVIQELSLRRFVSTNVPAAASLLFTTATALTRVADQSSRSHNLRKLLVLSIRRRELAEQKTSRRHVKSCNRAPSDPRAVTSLAH